MERAELLELLSPVGLRLLDSLPDYTSQGDVMREVTRLRREGHAAGLVATVLTQSRLRSRAAAKFGPFASRMLFTEAGLEQATRLPVAALHAGRYASAGLARVADLGCGIGADAMAMAALGIEIRARDIDEITAAIATYNLAPFENARVELGAAEDAELADVDAVFVDPARRTSGHTDTRRLTDPDGYSPSLDFAFSLAERLPTGVKLGPGFPRDRLPAGAEANWVSVDGHVVELGVWFGPLAREGVGRSATVLRNGSRAELTGAGDSADAEVGVFGEYVYEPDGAVIRSRLIGDLARVMGARMLGHGIAYLTSDEQHDTPFATGFRVLESLPYPEKDLARALRARKIGALEIKKRGVDVDPATLRTRLGLRGSEAATIILTRVAGTHTALLVERL